MRILLGRPVAARWPVGDVTEGLNLIAKRLDDLE
jgi:hypothetical protein